MQAAKKAEKAATKAVADATGPQVPTDRLRPRQRQNPSPVPSPKPKPKRLRQKSEICLKLFATRATRQDTTATSAQTKSRMGAQDVIQTVQDPVRAVLQLVPTAHGRAASLVIFTNLGAVRMKEVQRNAQTKNASLCTRIR